MRVQLDCLNHSIYGLNERLKYPLSARDLAIIACYYGDNELGSDKTAAMLIMDGYVIKMYDAEL